MTSTADGSLTLAFPQIHVVVSADLGPPPASSDEVELQVTGPVSPGVFASHTSPPQRDTFRFDLLCLQPGSGEISAHWQTPRDLAFDTATSAPVPFTCKPAVRLIAGRPIKEWANKVASRTAVVMAGLSTIGAVAAALGLVAFGLGLAIVAGLVSIASGIYWMVNSDPADPNYATIFTPEPLVLPVLDTSGLSPGAAEALNAYAQALAAVVEYGRAYYVSVNRAQGALEANDPVWYAHQVDAVRGFAGELAGAIGTFVPLQQGIRAALSGNGLPDAAIPLEVATQVQNEILASPSLPVDIAASLSAIGATPEEQSLIRSLAIWDEPTATSVYDVLDPAGASDQLIGLQGALQNFADGISVPVPAVTAVAPSGGPTAGGTVVTVTGTDLTGGTVYFGDAPATDSACQPTQCTATAPAGAGSVDVSVLSPGGRSALAGPDQYNYSAGPPVVTAVSPNVGPAAGGQTVTITGQNLAATTEIDFGTHAVPTGSCASDTTCTAASPGGSGTVDITVVSPAGRSATGLADRYAYLSAPVGPVQLPVGTLLSDGGFDPPLADQTDGFETIGPADAALLPVWTLASGTVDIVGPGWGQAAEGVQFLDLNGNGSADVPAGPAVMTQTFTATPGHKYRLAFQLSGNNNGDPTLKTLTASVDGTASDYSFDITDVTNADLRWQPQTLDGIVCGDTGTVTFASTTEDIRGPYIDAVSVVDLGPVDGGCNQTPPLSTSSGAAPSGSSGGSPTGTSAAASVIPQLIVTNSPGALAATGSDTNRLVALAVALLLPGAALSLLRTCAPGKRRH